MNMNIMNVKTRLIAVVSAGAVVWFGLNLSQTAVAQTRMPGASENYRPQAKSAVTPNPGSKQGTGGAIVAKQISPEDAAKKYPAPKGKYPAGERDPNKADGVVTSPYPPRTDFDCSSIPHGGLVLDTHVNKVFVRP
jgi:hypothetical protein